MLVATHNTRNIILMQKPQHSFCGGFSRFTSDIIKLLSMIGFSLIIFKTLDYIYEQGSLLIMMLALVGLHRHHGLPI